MSLSSRSSSSGQSSAGGNGQAPPVGYYAYRHPVGVDGGGMQQIDFMPSSLPRGYNFENNTDSTSRRKAGVSVQNGALNLHIPCAFSYAYDVPVPPQPESQARSLKAPSLNKGKDKKQPQRPSKSSSVPPPTHNFISTVKSGQMFKAKNVPHSREISKTQARTSVVWDYNAGKNVPFRAVDYGQELYEQAAQNLARQLQEQKLTDGKKSSSRGSTSTDIEDNCHDFSKPAIHSSKRTAKALEKAVEDLKKLPDEVEKLLRNDKRFEPIVTSKATRSLNVPRNTRVYKDLIPVDPNPDVKTEAEQMIQAEIKRSMEAVRQPARARDPEPKLEDFQTNSYTRIRPAAVPTPPKPTSGISIEANHDFDTIEAVKQLEHESNRSE